MFACYWRPMSPSCLALLGKQKTLAKKGPVTNDAGFNSLIIFLFVSFAHIFIFMQMFLLVLFTWQKRPAVVGTLDPRHLWSCYKEGWCVTKRTWHQLQTLMQIGKFSILSSQFVLANANDNTHATGKAGVSPSEYDTNWKLEPVNLSSFLLIVLFTFFKYGNWWTWSSTYLKKDKCLTKWNWHQLHTLVLFEPVDSSPFLLIGKFLFTSRQFILFTFSNTRLLHGHWTPSTPGDHNGRAFSQNIRRLFAPF